MFVKYHLRYFGQVPSQTLPSTPPSPLTYVPPGAAYVTVPGVLGKWSFAGQILDQYAQGEFEIWQEENVYKGKIKFSLPNVTDWLPLQDVSYNERTSTLTFCSPFWKEFVPYPHKYYQSYPGYVVSMSDLKTHLIYYARETILSAQEVYDLINRFGKPREIFKGPLFWEGTLLGQIMRLTCSWYEYVEPYDIPLNIH